MKELKAITEATIVKQKNELDVTELDGDKVMMDLERGSYFMFNEVATRIWDLAEKPRTVASIIGALVEEYEVDEMTCKQQSMEFIMQLVADELFVIENV